MEVFAAYAAFTDHEIGRIITAIEETGERGNTLIVYIAGDNGASAEGQMSGMYNELTYMNGEPESVPEMLKNPDKWGGPDPFPHMSAGWATAGNAPFLVEAGRVECRRHARHFHQLAGPDQGGGRNPEPVQSRHRHRADGPGSGQRPSAKDRQRSRADADRRCQHGLRLADAKVPCRHETQYVEIFGNRGVYHQGWFAGTIHKAPWEDAPRHKLTEDVWELYNVDDDFSQTKNLASSNPGKLKELQALFMTEAEKYFVLPVDDRVIERFDAATAGRPDLMAGRTSLTLYEGMTGISENAFINVKNRSVTITADVEIPAKGGSGVILCQGGRFGGWSLYIKDGAPVYTYNFVGLKEFTTTGSGRLAPGKATITADFAYDGNGRGKGGAVTMFVNGKQVGTGRIDQTNTNAFSADDLADVGIDEGKPGQQGVWRARKGVHGSHRARPRRHQVGRATERIESRRRRTPAGRLPVGHRRGGENGDQ